MSVETARLDCTTNIGCWRPCDTENRVREIIADHRIGLWRPTGSGDGLRLLITADVNMQRVGDFESATIRRGQQFW